MAKVWTATFNSCLTPGHMPKSWKRSDMFRLYKGKGSKEELDNYHGISLLCNPIKVLTKLG